MKIGVLFLSAAAFVLAGCGGGGGSNNAAMNTRTPDNPPAPTVQEIRDRATTAQQRLGSVTQSTNVNGSTNVVLDRVRVKLDESGNPVFLPDDNMDLNIVVENTHQGWEASNDTGYWKELENINDNTGGFTNNVVFEDDDGRLIHGTPVIDAANLTLKPPSEYQSGDYYLVTGLWYEDDNNFGVFADGPELTAPLPTSDSATYEGGAQGIYWDRTRTLAGADNFNADVQFQVVASGGRVAVSGQASNIRSFDLVGTQFEETPLLSNRTIRFNEMTYNPPGIANGEMTCEPNCDIQGSSWGGQFHGNPPAGNQTDGWPFSFNGTFGIQGLEYEGNTYDILGYFSSIHDGLPEVIACLRDGGFYGNPSGICGDGGDGGGGVGTPPVTSP